jgi:NADH dehydrogenase [ubiquinone] 1 alpha subcomplex assembly factor 1
MSTMLKHTILTLAISILLSTNMQKIYIFSTQTNMKDWRIVNDGVMGGVSSSTMVLTNTGHGQFAGRVSLANNGGFASVQCDQLVQLQPDKKWIVLRVKGDGKPYEFRLKASASQPESYVHPFVTTGEWQTIRLEISAFYPQFRGRKLNLPNFNFQTIAQMSFLIANKKEEDFQLLIDYIGLE